MGTEFMRAVGPKSIARIKAEEFLKTGSPGDTLNRGKAAELIGMPCTANSQGWGVMSRAVDFLATHGGPYWQWSRDDQHWLCLSDTEKVGSLEGRKRRARKANIKTIKVSECVDESNLNEDKKRDFRLIQLQCAMAAQASSPKMRRACIGTGVVDGLKLPDETKLIELMSKKDA